MAQNKRQHYRITYFAPEQPVFDCRIGKFTVLDLSESGIRIAFKKDSQLLSLNAILEGRIIFPLGRGEVRIKGRIKRVSMHDLVLNLEKDGQIPLARIMEEQRILINKGKLIAR